MPQVHVGGTFDTEFWARFHGLATPYDWERLYKALCDASSTRKVSFDGQRTGPGGPYLFAPLGALIHEVGISADMPPIRVRARLASWLERQLAA